jgi:hypothetical protein
MNEQLKFLRVDIFFKLVLCLREYFRFFPLFSSEMATRSMGRVINLSTCYVIGGSL